MVFLFFLTNVKFQESKTFCLLFCIHMKMIKPFSSLQIYNHISFAVFKMNIWIYWSESNSWIYFYIVLNNKLKNLLVYKVLLILGRRSSWGLSLKSSNILQHLTLYRKQRFNLYYFTFSFQMDFLWMFHVHLCLKGRSRWREHNILNIND